VFKQHQDEKKDRYAPVKGNKGLDKIEEHKHIDRKDSIEDDFFFEE